MGEPSVEVGTSSRPPRARWQATRTDHRGVALRAPAALALCLPLIGLLGVFFLGPIVMLIREVAGEGFSVVTGVISDEFFRSVTFRTFRIAAETTGLVLVIGYATAYAMWRSGPRVRAVLFAVMMFPLFTSVVVRTYAWTTMLSRNGVVNRVLQWVGLTDHPLQLMYTEWAVLIGVVQVLLPFSILPIYNSLTRVEPNVVRASSISGAKNLTTIRRVILPLTASSTIVAGVLVFVITLGFFVTPAILGGPRVSMISNVIGREVTPFLNLPRAAAMSLLLLGVTLVVISIAYRLFDVRRFFQETR